MSQSMSTEYRYDVDDDISSSISYIIVGFPRWYRGKESTFQSRRCRRCGFDPWVGKIP